jgi:urea carboxylase-associated protein 2
MPARQAHRLRYEALRAAGQGVTAHALPPPSSRDNKLPADKLLHHESVPGGWYYTTRLKRGEALRLLNTSGTSAVALMAWSEADASERLNLVDTMKVQWSICFGKARVVYTDMGRIAFSIIEDSCGAHDAVAAPTTEAMLVAASAADPSRNSRDNFLAAASKLGLSRRDVAGCLHFFAPVGVDASGRLAWRAGQRTPGDFVDLRAEMDLIVVLSNAGHPLDPGLGREPEAVEVLRFTAPPTGPDDMCRKVGAEAARAFEFTERHTGNSQKGDRS